MSSLSGGLIPLDGKKKEHKLGRGSGLAGGLVPISKQSSSRSLQQDMEDGSDEEEVWGTTESKQSASNYMNDFESDYDDDEDFQANDEEEFKFQSLTDTRPGTSHAKTTIPDDLFSPPGSKNHDSFRPSTSAGILHNTNNMYSPSPTASRGLYRETSQQKKTHERDSDEESFSGAREEPTEGNDMYDDWDEESDQESGAQQPKQQQREGKQKQERFGVQTTEESDNEEVYDFADYIPSFQTSTRRPSTGPGEDSQFPIDQHVNSQSKGSGNLSRTRTNPATAVSWNNPGLTNSPLASPVQSPSMSASPVQSPQLSQKASKPESKAPTPKPVQSPSMSASPVQSPQLSLKASKPVSKPSTPKPALDDSWGEGDDLLDSLMPESNESKPKMPASQQPVKVDSKSSAEPKATPGRRRSTALVEQDEKSKKDDEEGEGSGGYEFTTGRNLRSRSSLGAQRRRPISTSSSILFQEKNQSQKPSWLSDSSDDDDGPLFKTSKLPSSLTKPKEPAAPAMPASPPAASIEKETQDTATIPADTTFPDSMHSTKATDTNPVSALSEPDPSFVSQGKEELTKNQAQPTPTTNEQNTTKPATEGEPVVDKVENVASKRTLEAVSIDLSKVVSEIREEYQRMLSDEKEQWKASLNESMETFEKEREAFKKEKEDILAEQRETAARLKEVEHKLEQETASKALLERKLREAEVALVEKVAALEKEHKAALEKVKDDAQMGKLLASVASKVQGSAECLETLQMEVAKRHEASEKARVAQLECREKLVAEMEANLRQQLEHAAGESRKLESLYHQLESSQSLVRKQNEEDRIRLKEEHSRMEALQLTLKVESETLRTDAMEERARLREERKSLEAEKRDWQLRVHQKESQLESEKRSLEQQRASFDAERRLMLQEGESNMARIRSEEQEIREAREAQFRTRRLLEEQAAKLDEERDLVEHESRKNEEESARIAKDLSRLEALLVEVEKAEQHKKDAAKLQVEAMEIKQSVYKERAMLDKARQELMEEQRKFNELRLQVAKESSSLYKYKAEARIATDSARALERKVALQQVLPHFGLDVGQENVLTMGNGKNPKKPWKRHDDSKWLDELLQTAPTLSSSYPFN